VSPSEQVTGVGHAVQSPDSLVAETADTSGWRSSWTAVRKHTFCEQIFIWNEHRI